MDKRSNVLVIALFVLIVIGMFVFAYIKSKELQAPSQTIDTPRSTDTDNSLVMPDRITAKHYYLDGQHTFAGEIDMPTPCDLITVKSQVAESFPEQITLEFRLINNAENCPTVTTVQRFITTPIQASEEANIKATFDGKLVELNLVPAVAGEKPEEFELYQKG
jgi:hypothetical protein